jgi:REP element-mobilizing transposase RayT
MAHKARHQTQLLPFPCRGGARRGAGRKRKAERARVSHKARPRLAARHPVLVTVRMLPGLPSLRRKREFELIRDRFKIAAERFGARVVEYSVQSNHAHLIVEAADEHELARAMKGLLVRIARGLNRLWCRTGSVLDDHYHARALKTPREVRNALVYVLNNAHKHGVHMSGPDPFSSGFSFDGWKDLGREALGALVSPLARARTWLLSIGWCKHGRIATTERPARQHGVRAG